MTAGISSEYTSITANPEAVSMLIRERRSVYADEFDGRPVPDEVLFEILTNATWAPTHKMTEPWRFMVFREKYLKDFGRYLADYYTEYYKSRLSPKDFEEKYRYLVNYPSRASCLIGVVMTRSAGIALPEWEEIAAVSCAVQNLALSCTSYGLGGYWSTVDGAIDYLKQFGLRENEQSLGIFYMGYRSSGPGDIYKRRTPAREKTIIFE